jgi:hypothetical protein
MRALAVLAVVTLVLAGCSAKPRPAQTAPASATQEPPRLARSGTEDKAADPTWTEGGLHTNHTEASVAFSAGAAGVALVNEVVAIGRAPTNLTAALVEVKQTEGNDLASGLSVLVYSGKTLIGTAHMDPDHVLRQRVDAGQWSDFLELELTGGTDGGVVVAGKVAIDVTMAINAPLPANFTVYGK